MTPPNVREALLVIQDIATYGTEEKPNLHDALEALARIYETAGAWADIVKEKEQQCK